ncbi:hypothetical protein GW17_00060894 [Ensete ventricosum]|nr:hypothetical protein GW17_00060894 [Ensete ventricosum]
MGDIASIFLPTRGNVPSPCAGADSDGRGQQRADELRARATTVHGFCEALGPHLTFPERQRLAQRLCKALRPHLASPEQQCLA